MKYLDKEEKGIIQNAERVLKEKYKDIQNGNFAPETERKRQLQQVKKIFLE